ncbi:Sodium:solute symporter family-domain-containing protein [Halteromyces radiatus]|uniref:Sodium:solute symporter family-domain-containing protein n=1 Tax=Halteromyces radiatus TaxID=101107 RepID=UPI002220B6E1|nr:Sodium:solute symporter family-domain-containing protein [Halteromyces radiatus]KAI8081683.1 Sodium:solute symporter family-domain-containing protein [Halteromyces radiatus]
MAVLSEGAGYAVVLGFGALFAVCMTLVTMGLKRYLHEVQTSEMYMTAQRSIKTGLVASAVVSSWTWAATLLTSTEVAYKYGVAGPIWYASGAVVQVLLFSVLAIELKRKAPNAHTFLEVVNARYGKTAHIVYLVFSLFTNIIVTAMLLLGGSAVITYLTGMNVIAACFLLPLGVIVYTLFGGIKATFLTDYAHTAILFIIIISFYFTVYSTSPLIGSPGKMYDLLVASSIKTPIVDNEQGSLVTFSSLQALIFGIINIVGNFGTVFLDNCYYQRAISSKPEHAVKAYLMGGLSWFAIPFTLATTMGLAARALEIELTPQAVSQGLVLVESAIALSGTLGAFGALVLVFMAVTSASSAELISVSSIFTYDVYRTYIRPGASGKAVIHFSHAAVLTFGILMGVLAVLLNLTGIALGYLYTLMGVLISSAVVPLTLTLLWSKQNKLAAIVSPIFGFVAAVITWLTTTYGLYGTITVDTTSQNMPMMAGNLVALLSPIPCTLILTFLNPDNYDFESTRNIQLVTDDENVPEEKAKQASESGDHIPTVEEMEFLNKSARFAKMSSVILAVCLFLVWPLPMFFSRYVFSKEFFTGWVVVGIIWTFFSTAAVVIYPVYESIDSLKLIGKAIWADLRGKRKEMVIESSNRLDQQVEENTNAYIVTDKSKEIQ